MSAVEEIRIKLEARLREIDTEIESLRSALNALDEQAAASQAGQIPEAPSPRPAVSNGRRRAARNGAAPRRSARASAELEQLLAQTGGMTAVELARETGTDYAEVLARIQELERAGRARGDT